MTMTTATGSGKELTAEQVIRILTKPLEARSSFLASGPRIFDSAGPLRIPAAASPVDLVDLADNTVGGDADAFGFTGEAEAIPEQDQTFGEVRLLPSTMRSVKVITRYTNELARQSVVSLEAALRDRLVVDVANLLDRQFYSAGGDGVNNPMGRFAWSGVQSVPVGGALELDDILAAQALALGGNVNMDALRLFLTPADYMALRAVKESDTSGRYLLQPDAQSGAVARVLGLPVVISSHIPAGYGALADMSQVAVARDLAPSVKVLTERYADTDEQALRVVARYDVKPLNPAAVVTFTGITVPVP